MFISFEGIDGAGKSTQIEILASFIKEQFQKNVVVTREPGGTEVGKRIRKEILHGDLIDKRTELLLYAADRAEHLDKVIKPALERGEFVITDRFSDSTVAYQVGGREIDSELVAQINNLATDSLKPDLTILLDLTVEESQKRISLNRSGKDRLESESNEFFEKVRKKFLEIAAEEPERVKVIPATLEIHEISAEIFAEFALKIESQNE